MAGRRALALGDAWPLNEKYKVLTKRWLVRVQHAHTTGWLAVSSFDREYDAKREWEMHILSGVSSTIIDQFKREEN